MNLLKNFIQKPPLRSAESRLMHVSMEQIIPDPKNERQTFANMEGLVTSIRNVGIIEPPIVKLLPNQRFQILTGHRRWAAAQQLGLKSIDVLVRSSSDAPEDPRLVRLKSLISNLQRESVPPIELAETLQGLLDDPNGIETQRQLAACLGKTESWVSDTLSLLRFSPELQERLRHTEKRLPLDAISKIARLEDHPQRQEQLLGDVLAGASTATIRERLHEAQPTNAKNANPRHPKPKVSFRTGQHAVVIVQSRNHERLTPARQREALLEAYDTVAASDR